LRNLRIEYGGDDLFSGVDLTVHERDHLCLVGRNGSGKSTLLKLAAGLIEPDDGERIVRAGVRMAYLEQDPDLSGFSNVHDYVASGLEDLDGETNGDHKVDAVLQELRLEPDMQPGTLSGGEQRRAALARILISNPDILFLDEPTNHLDLPTVEWLEGYLRSFNGAFVLISHDRAFLRNLTDACLWLEGEKVRRHNKGFEFFEDWSEKEFEKMEVERHKLDRYIAREVHWSLRGVTARRKKNQGRLRRLYGLRDERAKQILRVGKAAIAADTGKSSGQLVIEAKNVSKHYEGADRPIIGDFSTRIMRGDKIGIVGANGTGKTTLLNLLTKKLEPDQGTVRMGTNLTPIYIDQKRASLDPELTLWETLCEGGGDQVMVRGRPVHVVTYLKDYLFVEGQARQPVRSLSGGERNRLLLAKALALPSNFMVLDEPTNDLDMDTLDLLQEMLSDYEGTILLVSHDRDFLDRVVTSTIVLDGSGQAEEFAGGYTDMIAQRGGRPFANVSTGVSESPPRKAAKKTSPATSASAPKKLSYKFEHRAKELAALLPTLEGQIRDLEAAMADGSLYTADPAAFSQKAKQLDEAKLELSKNEEEWLEIEMMREELEA
jgi:ATP-binding cassette subfamily F protein uup